MKPAPVDPLSRSLQHGWRRRTLSGLAGVAVSGLILLGIVKAQKTGIIPFDTPPEDLRATVLRPPPPPPPPPPATAPETPSPPQLSDLPEIADESVVQIAVEPLDRPPSRPVAQPELAFTLEHFRPETRALEPDRETYRYSDVDQPPIPIYKKVPHIRPSLLKGVDLPRVVIMYMVDAEGAVGSVYLLGSANPEFDAALIRAAEKWRFKPARKDGRAVRCWVRHRITVDTTPGSPFRFD